MKDEQSFSGKEQQDSSGDIAGIRINARITVPRSEIVIRATRSSGPGGQHVNKTSSRIELVWNISTSDVLSDNDRALLASSLSSKLSANGELRIVVSDTRSQHKNREIAEERFAETVRKALVIPKARKQTRPSRQQKQARLEAKSRISEKKTQRRKPGYEE